MAETKTLNVRFQQKWDTAENWAASSNILLAGEIAIESDTGKFKFGNGVDVYTDLSYAGIDTAQLEAIEDNYYKVIPTTKEDGELQTDAEALATIASPAKGDIAVVERVIDASGIGTATSMTAYMYDGEKWCALDGNYSASNVYLPKAITLAGDYTSIGNYSKGDVIAAGTSLEALFNGLLQQELYPTASIPTASITLSGTTTGEAGASYTTPTATLKITSVGSYTYGPATGITFDIGNVKLAEGAEPTTATNFTINTSALGLNNTITLKSATTSAVYTDGGQTYTFSGTATHTQGAMPVTNLGNNYESVRINASDITIADSSKTFKAWRNYWYGFISTTDYATISRNTSTNVVGDGTKNLTAGGAAISNKTLPTITATSGDRMPVVVMPTSANKTVKSATMPSSLNAPVTFTKLGTVDIHGYNGYDAVSYDVWGYVADDMPVGADFSIVIG